MGGLQQPATLDNTQTGIFTDTRDTPNTTDTRDTPPSTDTLDTDTYQTVVSTDTMDTINIGIFSDNHDTVAQPVESPKGENLPSGGPEGNQTFLRGAALKGSLIAQCIFSGQIFQTNPEDFPLFFKLLD